MPKINEATDTDLKVIDELTKLGWKRGDTLLYQQEYILTPEQQKVFEGRKSIKPDITLTDLNGNIIAIFENKFKDEKKALTKLRTLYSSVLKPRFLYACSPERTLFYDTEWKGFDGGEFHQVNSFMTLEEMKLKIEQAKKINITREIVIDSSIAGGFDKNIGKNRYYHEECIKTLIERFKRGKPKMLVHMATGLGKTRMAVAFVKALLEYNMAKRILFVVDRVMLAEQGLNDGFSLIGGEFSAVRISTSNYKQYKNAQIHIVVIDTLENIYQNIPSTFYDLIIVDECHRSININRTLIFDHFLCPRLGLTATPRTAIAKKGKDIPEEDLAILDTYKLFGCDTGEPDYQFDLARGIEEGFLAPYTVLSIETELTKTARESTVDFDYFTDVESGKRVCLDKRKQIKLEQLNRKFIAWDNCLRVAEELKKNTDYGEKVILFSVSQAHAVQLVKAINQVFRTEADELSPRYAEAIISDNNELNATFKKWFKDPTHKPFIAVSVDIMSTGVDIPCVRYISFATLTKSVGKYIQMLGRGTRIDTKTGKLSFKVLDFVGLCNKDNMADNGKGTLKENVKAISSVGGTTRQGTGAGEHWGTMGGIIDNPDPAHLIQRVYLHGDKIRVIDNIPIEQARALFEAELEKETAPEVVEIKVKAKKDESYEPTEQEVDTIINWTKNPNVFLNEGQLKKVYNYEQGSIWDFFLHALKIRQIPTPQQRIEKGFESYIKTYNFNDKQIKILRDMKDIVSANIAERKEMTPQEIFNNPIFARLIGIDYQEVNQAFGNHFPEVFEELQANFKV
jgi:type I site-specific restriction endonuclease